MLRLSKKADYALIAMKHLAINRDGAVSVSAREIAEQYDIPIELMAKVLQRLAASISVSDVIQAIDGPFSVTACSTENSDCEQYSKCSVRDPLWQIRERIAAALATVSVAEMAADQIKGEGPLPGAETVSAPVAITRRATV
jgi:DNA-binding IscR family transcriptional regulator